MTAAARRRGCNPDGCTQGARSTQLWSSKDVLFWERRRVSHPTLVTDGETGCKYQTLYKHGDDTPPQQTHTLSHSSCVAVVSLPLSSLSLNSRKRLAKGENVLFQTRRLFLQLQLMYDHSSSSSSASRVRASLARNAAMAGCQQQGKRQYCETPIC